MFEFIILIISIVFHEVAHGYAANWLGDPTARLAGRLSANPLLHIDPVGSIIVPAMTFLTTHGILGNGMVFGWAKPVPYNPYNLRNQRWGESIVAAAGPLANLFLAVIFSVLIRMSGTLGFPSSFIDMASYVVLINILLALFNSIPFPPLDGSKIIVPFLPFGLEQKYRALITYMENLGVLALFLLVFIFMQILWSPFSQFVMFMYHILSGL
jgi:Zn-dependent protease